MPRLEVFKEFWVYAKGRKKYWLLPVALIIFLAAIFIVATESTAVAPLIYAIF